MQPASTSIPEDIRATLVRLLAYMGGLAALAVAAASFFAAPADIVAALGSASAQRPAWRTVERPYPAFELLMPELIGSTYNYAIQRRAKDGARKDLLSFGEPGDAGPPMPWSKSTGRPWPAIASSMRRAKSPPASSITPSPTTSSRTARSTANSARCRWWILPRAQWPNPAMSAAASASRGRSTSPPCKSPAGIAAPAGEVVDRTIVACLLDRLTLVKRRRQARRMFARAEIKRPFCGQRSPILAATPEREESLAPQRKRRSSERDVRRATCKRTEASFRRLRSAPTFRRARA